MDLIIQPPNTRCTDTKIQQQPINKQPVSLQQLTMYCNKRNQNSLPGSISGGSSLLWWIKLGGFVNAVKNIELQRSDINFTTKNQFDNIARSIESSSTHAPQGVMGPTNKTADNILLLGSPWLP